MNNIQLLQYTFEYIQDICPVKNRDGTIREFTPQDSYSNHTNTPLNKYGSGTFCKFSIHPKWSGISGVYVFIIGEKPVYIGQALDFAKRFNMGYGNISPRNCFEGGQSTNCKINHLVLDSIKKNQPVSIYFHITSNYANVEKELIQHFNPQYNTQLKSTYISLPSNSEKKTKATPNRVADRTPTNPSSNDVQRYIRSKISHAIEKKAIYIDIVSGQIHKELNMTDRMPTVCSAMRQIAKEYQYEILESPAKGNGSRLVHRYYIDSFTH